MRTNEQFSVKYHQRHYLLENKKIHLVTLKDVIFILVIMFEQGRCMYFSPEFNFNMNLEIHTFMFKSKYVFKGIQTLHAS